MTREVIISIDGNKVANIQGFEHGERVARLKTDRKFNTYLLNALYSTTEKVRELHGIGAILDVEYIEDDAKVGGFSTWLGLSTSFYEAQICEVFANLFKVFTQIDAWATRFNPIQKRSYRVLEPSCYLWLEYTHCSLLEEIIDLKRTKYQVVDLGSIFEIFIDITDITQYYDTNTSGECAYDYELSLVPNKGHMSVPCYICDGSDVVKNFADLLEFIIRNGIMF